MKTQILALALLSLTVAACGGKQRGSGQQDALPIIAQSLESSAFVSDLVALQYIESDNWQGCLATRSLSELFRMVADAINQPEVAFPGVSLDLSKCLAINDRIDTTFEEDATAGMVIGLVGRALSTVQFFIKRMDDPDQCRSRTIAEATVTYLRDAVEPIVLEISNPDGMLVIPEVVIDYSNCEPTE